MPRLLAFACAISLAAAAWAAGGEGAPAPNAEAPESTTELPSKPLEAKLERLSGERFRLSELRGRPLLLELWATWCLPCQEQARIVGELADELAARGVAVLALSQGEEADTVRPFVERQPSHFPVALDRRQLVSAALDIGELPALVLLDAAGKPLAVRLGLTQRPDLLSLLATLDPASSG